MSGQTPSPRRGRPPSITRARIARAGMEIGLPALTFTGVAAQLGVSQMALYKHVPSIEALRSLVAEEMFADWSLPTMAGESLEAYLLRFVDSLQDLIRACPGLAWYLVRRNATTPAMMAIMVEHHGQIARAYGISEDRARWLLSTVAIHAIVLADTLYAILGEESDGGLMLPDSPLESDFNLGMRALVSGALAMVHEQPDR